MGSEKRSREEKGARRSPSVRQEEESARSKRRKSTEPSDDKSKKRSSKHRSSHSKEKKSEDKHKSKHHKRDQNLKHEFKELSKDDYFSKSNEFATWLKEEKDVFFSDLSSDSARELFSQFVKAWNKQKLEPRYYEGIASGPRSSHKWKIKQ